MWTFCSQRVRDLDAYSSGSQRHCAVRTHSYCTLMITVHLQLLCIHNYCALEYLCCLENIQMSCSPLRPLGAGG